MIYWEEAFLSGLNHVLYRPRIWLTVKQQAKMEEIKDKLHFEHPDDPLPAIDPDGVQENDDPDGWPQADCVAAFDEEEIPPDWLIFEDYEPNN